MDTKRTDLSGPIIMPGCKTEKMATGIKFKDQSQRCIILLFKNWKNTQFQHWLYWQFISKVKIMANYMIFIMKMITGHSSNAFKILNSCSYFRNIIFEKAP